MLCALELLGRFLAVSQGNAEVVGLLTAAGASFDVPGHVSFPGA